MDSEITKSKAKTVSLVIPFVLITLFAAVFFGGAMLLFIYAIVLTAAFESAMVFFFLLACSALAMGIGIFLIIGFFTYKDYYMKRQSDKPYAKLKGSKTYRAVAVAGYALLITGVITTVIAAALGAMDKDKWVVASADYYHENGYFETSQLRDVEYSNVKNIEQINISLDTKNAVVIYESVPQSAEAVRLRAYLSYENQVKFHYDKDTKTLSVTETPSPKLQRPMESMLFFLFSENEAERQIRIFVPEAYRNKITVNGEHITAQSIEEQMQSLSF